ncbi:MAG: M23 family metallopeptidase [Prolixibacteraceae bacterium]
MYKVSFILPLIFILSNSLWGQTIIKPDFSLPLKGPYSFSGGFGELRRNHFHTGLDFRTAGQVGIPVYAFKEGSIARVSVSPSGYGHALYLLHPDGKTTVYGHLSRFNPKIETYVLSEQYRLKQFAVDLTIPAGLFAFKKGEIIAWSGNTGSSGGPHLHFEIRDTQTEKPQNPLLYLSGITDKSAPRILSLFVYPISAASSVNKGTKILRVETISSRQNTSTKLRQPIEVYGEIGFGIQADDDFNGVGMKCGIFSAELIVDQEPAFSFQLDHLSFDLGRYVNSHIDYEELIKNKRWIHRLYLQPGNKMDIYQTNSSRGIVQMFDGKIHDAKIVVRDAFGNFTQLAFKLISKKFQVTETKQNCTKLFFYDRPNDYENSEVRVQLPDGTLYDQLPFEYLTEIRKGVYYSKIHHIHKTFVPVQKPYKLSIKTLSIPTKLQSKALIVQVDASGRFSSAGGEYLDGWITAYPRAFGAFGVMLDTIAPIIRPLSIKENKNLVNKQKIEFKITDNLSGISSYEGEIDGNWVLFEYDAKTDTIFYTIDKSKLVLGKSHTIKLTVRDERNNSSEYKAVFYL